MFSKVYEKIKNYIKQNYKFILTLLVTYIVLTFPLPYYIYTTGGTIDINDRVEVEDGYEAKGSFNFAYVSELRATIPTYLLSMVIPSWERVKIEDYKLDENESVEDVSFRDHISLEQANQSALKVAFEKANLPFEVVGSHHYVVYLDPNSNTDIEIGDEILELDGEKITSMDDYRNIVARHDYHDVLTMKVKRDGKELEKTIEVIEKDGEKLTGISITTLYDYQTDPEVTFHFSKAESGPSGGLMLTLSIYNKLVEEDITYGKKIVGTGTIDENGNVGEIGGVEYKLRGAEKEKADLFLVPAGQNYEDCMKIKEEENLKIKVIPVKNFDEALLALQTLKDTN